MKNVSSSNSQGELVPKLRFPGFEGEYSEVTIGDLFRERSARAGGYEELLSVTMNDGVKRRSELDGKDNSSEDKSNYKVVCAGDIVYNSMRMWQGASGVSPYDGIVSPAYTVLEPRVDLDERYIGAYFKTTSLINKFRRNSQGMTSDTWNLKYPQISPIKISVPSKTEQNKVAEFLRAIEKRIDIQLQLIESLKSYKRGLIRTLLSPDRNKRAGVEWTSALIGDLGKFIKGAPLSKADISSKGNPFILYGELYTTYGEVITNVVRKTEAKVDSVCYSKVGDVIVPTSGETPEEISTASCVMAPDVILAGDLNIFRTTKVDGRILSYILNHIVNWQIARIAQGKSVVHIQSSELAQIEIVIPDNDEQKRIVAAVDGVDKIVTNSENTLERLVAVKNALLQQLFI